MASIHKRPGSKFWHGAWRDSSGKLHLRSTGQTDRTKALDFVREIERAERLAAVESLTETKAREILASILERTGIKDTMAPPPSMKTYSKDWITAKENSGKAAGTVARYQGVVDGFLNHIGGKQNRGVDAVTIGDVDGFLAARRKSGVSTGTVALDCKILRALFGKARREGHIATNPAEGVELAKVHHVERGTFTPAEIKILIDTAEGEWKTLIMVGYFTGQRLGDCCGLQWDSIDFNADTITFQQQKTDEAVTVPIHPDLLAHLEKLTGDRAEQYVMPHLAALGPGGRHGLSEGFKRLMRKAGLDVGTVQGSGVRKISRRSFHALRHSFTSSLANAGVSPELRMKLTGHKSPEVHRGYTHHELATLRNAVNKLPSILK